MNVVKPTVLHVDDDPNDLLLFQRASAKAGASFQIQTANEGEEAIAYLSGTGAYGDRAKYPLPAVILLDLKMPRLSGFEVLVWIRSQDEFKRLPVITFTASNQLDDIHEAYAAGANSYLVKPIGFDVLTEVAKQIDAYWLALNQRPSA